MDFYGLQDGEREQLDEWCRTSGCKSAEVISHFCASAISEILTFQIFHLEKAGHFHGGTTFVMVSVAGKCQNL